DGIRDRNVTGVQTCALPIFYKDINYNFEIGKAVTMNEGKDITIIVTGETVRIALDTAIELKDEGISCRVLNMHTIKPLDKEAIVKASEETGHIITLEEHSVYGGLGAAVSEVVSQNNPVPMRIMGVSDEPAITGNAKEVFKHYGLDVKGVSHTVREMIGY